MLITRIFATLFPIFAIVMVGYFYARYRPLDMTAINHLNMAVFNPALLFSVLSDKSFNITEYQNLTLATIMIILGCGIIVLPLIKILNVHPKTFIPSMMFANTGNMGIPVILFAFGETALQTAVLFLIITAVLHFTLGIYIMNRSAPWLSIIKLPVIQATVIGLIVSTAQINIPELLLTPIKMLGACAIPLMLISLGVRLVETDLTHWRVGLLGAVSRPLSGLLIFLLIRPWFTFTSLQEGLLLIFAVLPPAILNYIIAEQYQQEPQKVAAIVMLGNVASFISLPIALAFALPSN